VLWGVVVGINGRASAAEISMARLLDDMPHLTAMSPGDSPAEEVGRLYRFSIPTEALPLPSVVIAPPFGSSRLASSLTPAHCAGNATGPNRWRRLGKKYNTAKRPLWLTKEQADALHALGRLLKAGD
jgi:hypothetical protein